MTGKTVCKDGNVVSVDRPARELPLPRETTERPASLSTRIGALTEKWQRKLKWGTVRLTRLWKVWGIGKFVPAGSFAFRRSIKVSLKRKVSLQLLERYVFLTALSEMTKTDSTAFIRKQNDRA